jgi:ATP-dependent Clp protease ATP-binding subunit ClpC
MAGRSINDQVIQILRVALERPAIGFAEDAQMALNLASEEAKRLNHGYIGTEHILLGLAAGESITLNKALAESDIAIDPYAAICTAVESIIGRGAEPPAGELRLTPRAQRVIELAKDAACWFGDTEVTSWHFLVGIIREGEGVAYGALELLGANFEKVFASR